MTDIKKIKRKIDFFNKKIEEIKLKHGDNPTENYNYYGGYSLGYWEGKLSTYEDLLDSIDEGSNTI